MKKILFICFMLPVLSWAQDSTSLAPDISRPVNPVNYLEKSVWRLDFFGPGLINESQIGQKTTLVSQLRTVSIFNFYNNQATSTAYSAYTINPQLSVGIRQFYNFNRRLARGKSIRYNSGNYITAKLAYILPALIRHNTDRLFVRNIEGFSEQVMWGFQRTYRKNFYLNLEAGLGFGDYYRNPVTVATYFTLGYTFPNKSQVVRP